LTGFRFVVQTVFGLHGKLIMQDCNTSTIRAARARAQDYWEIDGLPKIVSGISTLVMGTLYFFMLRNESAQLLALVGVIAVFLFEIQGGQEDILGWLKARITYPRTGYVDSQGETRPLETAFSSTSEAVLKVAPLSRLRQKISSLGLIILFSALLFCWGNAIYVGTPWICVSAGALSSICILLASHRRRSNLAWLTSVGWMLIGVALATWPVARHARVIFLFMGSGSLSLLIGTIALLQYLYRPPLPKNLRLPN
jgi:hypothetical protein